MPITTNADLSTLNLFLYRINMDGKIESVQDIFCVPKSLIDYSEFVQNTCSIETGIPGQGSLVDIPYFTLNMNYTHNKTPIEITSTFNKPLSFSDYTPKNNKLYCYPTNFIYGTNNNGESEVYKIEDFSNNSIVFKLKYAISIGGSGLFIPNNYKGQSENIDESLALGKFPTFQWSSDAYTNWLTQNAVNNQNRLLNTGLTVASQVASGNAVGGLVTVAQSVINNYQAFYEANLLPNKVSGTNTGDVSFSDNKITMRLLHMRAKKEYLQCLDDFLYRFGYQVNRVKVPNITGRTNFNYVEIGANDEIGIGNVPHKFMEEINSIARKGVTIWHNHTNIGDFSITNTIVTP